MRLSMAVECRRHLYMPPYRDEPLGEVAPATTEPAAEAQSLQVVAGQVLERLGHLVREQPALLHGPGEKIFNIYAYF